MNNMRRLEEILEECVTAHLEGRRSINESLSLYPSYARDLEPLLRTAATVTSTLGGFTPPAHIQQRGLHRFISAARDRRNLKALAGSSRSGWLTGLWSQHRMAFSGAAAALAVIAIAVSALAFSGGLGNDGDGRTSVSTDAPGETVLVTPEIVDDLQDRLRDIQSRLDQNQAVDPAKIIELTDKLQLLTTAPAADIEESRAEIEAVLNTAASQLDEIAQTQPDSAVAATEGGEVVRDVAGGFNIPLPSTPVIATDPPTPAPSGEPTAPPTDAPAAPPTAAPTEPPTPTTSSETEEDPEIREVPGFSLP